MARTGRRQSSTQAPHGVRDALASLLELEPGQVHVVTPDVGGGFGAKAAVYPEDIVVGWCALKLGRAVRWTETRSESMLGLGHGRAQVQHVRIGGTRDGVVQSYRIEVLQDSGAYAGFGTVLPFMTRVMTSGPSRFEGGVFECLGRHELDADHGLPRCRSRPRAARGHRTDHGRLRARNRHGPRRAAPSKLDRQ